MSEIWAFFSISKNDSSRALCNECDANISRGKNPKTYSTSPGADLGGGQGGPGPP